MITVFYFVRYLYLKSEDNALKLGEFALHSSPSITADIGEIPATLRIITELNTNGAQFENYHILVVVIKYGKQIGIHENMVVCRINGYGKLINKMNVI